MENGHTESLLVTDNTKLAAVLLAFGTRLRRHQPLTWVNIFQSVAAFLAYRRSPATNNKPQVNVSFNFEPDGVDVKGIIKTFGSQESAEDAFSTLVQSAGLDSGLVKKLLAAHSKAMVQACREALEAREYLVREHMKKFPESAKVNRVQGPGKTFAAFGVQASKETIAEQLNKIGYTK
jgi:hypothetical protein